METYNISTSRGKNASLHFVCYFVYFFIFISLTSCLEVKQGININRDGSGDVKLELAVQREWASQIIPKLKADIPKGWKIIEEKEREGKQAIVIGRKFKTISELNDNETRYSLSIQDEGFLKKSYSLEIEQLKTTDAPFPYEFTINVPGNIAETNGIKVSSNQAKWNLFGMKRGTKLILKSSSFLFPSSVTYLILGFGIIILIFIAVKILRRSKAPALVADISSNKIFCTQCGKENRATDTFCTTCGVKLQ